MPKEGNLNLPTGQAGAKDLSWAYKLMQLQAVLTLLRLLFLQLRWIQQWMAQAECVG